MTQQKLMLLLSRARAVLERHLFEADDERIRDDVAEICMAIDDALLRGADVQPREKEHLSALETSAA